MPRLFTGIEIPAEIGLALSGYRGGLPGARWVEPENYHITLRFMGDIDERMADDISSLLGETRRRGPTVITIDGLDSFGGRKPRAVFARTSGNGALSELQAEQEQLMRQLGLAPETRKFTPHVTLARLKNVSPIDVADYIAMHGHFPKLTFTAERFVLYSSRASVGGGPYVIEAAYPLSQLDGPMKDSQSPLMPSLIFITHPEVVIDPNQPVPEWPLNAVGRGRMEHFAGLLTDRNVSAVYSSTERKAMDGAAIVAERLGLPARTNADLGENDRSSTGYIAPPEFWEVVRAFFGRPHESIRGWERAIDAQTRIVTAVSRIAREDETSGSIVIVSHGGVGCLLAAHLQKVEIGQESRPSHPGGGCFIVIDRETLTLQQNWRAIEDGFAS